MKTVEREIGGFPLRQIVRIDVEPLSEAQDRNRQQLLRAAKTHSEMLRLLAHYQKLHLEERATENDVQSIRSILLQTYADEEAAVEAPVFQHKRLIVFDRIRLPLPSKRAA